MIVVCLRAAARIVKCVPSAQGVVFDIGGARRIVYVFEGGPDKLRRLRRLVNNVESYQSHRDQSGRITRAGIHDISF
jgi:hypothetical protein